MMKKRNGNEMILYKLTRNRVILLIITLMSNHHVNLYLPGGFTRWNGTFPCSCTGDHSQNQISVMKGRMLKEYYEQTPVINNQSPAYRDFYEWIRACLAIKPPLASFLAMKSSMNLLRHYKNRGSREGLKKALLEKEFPRSDVSHLIWWIWRYYPPIDKNGILNEIFMSLEYYGM